MIKTRAEQTGGRCAAAAARLPGSNSGGEQRQSEGRGEEEEEEDAATRISVISFQLRACSRRAPSLT